MSNEDHLDPATLALLDQVQAGSLEYLDGLVRAYQDTLREGRVEGIADVMTMVVCAATLREELPAEILAGTLAVAVMRLAGEGSRHG